MAPMEHTVLAIMAHPDDAEQYAGGTLILLRKAGYRLVIAPLSDGACGSHTLTDTEIVAVRSKESLRVARKIGATYRNLGIRDGCIAYDLETVRKIVVLLREFQPQIVITHPTEDYMADHTNTARVVLWAIPEACHKNFMSDSPFPFLPTQPYLFHTDPQGLIGSDGQIVRANTVVDISDVTDEKLTAFSEHKSQMGFLSAKKRGSLDAMEKTKRWAITRGQQVRVLYGEGFTQGLLEQYPRVNILAKILGDRVYTL